MLHQNWLLGDKVTLVPEQWARLLGTNEESKCSERLDFDLLNHRLNVLGNFLHVFGNADIAVLLTEMIKTAELD